jgi:hypothetical protein
VKGAAGVVILGVGFIKMKCNTESRGDVDIDDVEIEGSVFEKAEATLSFLGPVADAVW